MLIQLDTISTDLSECQNRNEVPSIVTPNVIILARMEPEEYG